jgi:hypothetical protein
VLYEHALRMQAADRLFLLSAALAPYRDTAHDVASSLLELSMRPEEARLRALTVPVQTWEALRREAKARGLFWGRGGMKVVVS